MKKNLFNYYFKFYFFAVLFFIEGVWLRSTGKYVAPSVPALPDENWLEEGEVKVSVKPPQAEALANKANLGLSQVPEKYRKYVVWGIILLVFFLLFGIVNFIYWSAVIIKAYPTVGWILLYSLCAYILYRIGKSIYKYFSEKKYHKLLTLIKIIWSEAKQKAEIKFQ